jgi:hypothetical protein
MLCWRRAETAIPGAPQSPLHHDAATGQTRRQITPTRSRPVAPMPGPQLLAIGDFTSVPPAGHRSLGSSLGTVESTPDRAGRAEGTLTSHKRLRRGSRRCP